jgi:hypothetical protein
MERSLLDFTNIKRTKMKHHTLIVLLLLGSTSLHSQAFKFDKKNLEAVNVSLSLEKLKGKDVVKVIKDPTVREPDEPTFVKIKGVEFINGTIEVTVLSKLLPNAPEGARGFIGVAFRIDDRNSKFECLYIRPTNGRADDQLRRNHATQYFSFPDYKFDRLRNEANGVYESYADMALNEWIKIKIEVTGQRANLFLNDNKQPSLIVNDLKHGDSSSGTIGLYVDNGTEGFFTDLKIRND